MYEDIKEQFKLVIAHSQSIEDPKVDYLFDRWQAAKQKFIKRFGGLIYEWPNPIEFTLDNHEKQNRAMEFANIINDTFNNPALAEFIDANLDGFFDNKIIHCEEYASIPKDMKLIKAFKFFEADRKKLRAIQDYASSYIQENKIKGTLCFSVHPLDFLSSSENTYKWRSCHSLDGEYRAGNLSYMVDETTFMVYLKGSDNQQLAAFGSEVLWNSKKWRMLIHAATDDEIIFAGRQYPFSSKPGIDIVLNIYNNLMAMNQNCCSFLDVDKYAAWQQDYVDSYTPRNTDCPIDLCARYVVFDDRLIDINELVVAAPNSLNYNDILYSTCYKYPYYAILNPWSYHSYKFRKEHSIEVGGEIPCLHCAEELIQDSETMRCDDCELKYGYEENDTYGSCACCGARLYRDNATWITDEEENVCDTCFNNNCFICDICDEIYFNEQKHYITGAHGEECYCCEACYRER